MPTPAPAPRESITPAELALIRTAITQSNPVTWNSPRLDQFAPKRLIQIMQRCISRFITRGNPFGSDYRVVSIPLDDDRIVLLTKLSFTSSDGGLKPPFYAAQIGQAELRKVQVSVSGPIALELWELMQQQLKGIERLAMEFLTSLSTSEEIAKNLKWKVTHSGDERETNYSAQKDKFDIKVQELVKGEMLGLPLAVYSAEIGFNNGLVAPLIVSGENVKDLFSRIKALPRKRSN